MISNVTMVRMYMLMTLLTILLALLVAKSLRRPSVPKYLLIGVTTVSYTHLSHGAWSAEHGAGLRFACGSLGIPSLLQRCHQFLVARN